MEKMLKRICLLALGAVIVSCQQEEPIVETPEEAGVSKVTVTAGAGIVQTKSAVVTVGTTRSLSFTTGDRLYVRGLITGTDPQKIVAGYLDIVGTPEEGATHADFSGTLDVYVFASAGTPDVYSSSTYEFTDASNPLAECSSILGWLVHNDAVGFTVDAGQNGAYTNTIAATVNELMSHSLPVYGFYDEGSFPLSVGDSPSTCTPIFNVNLSGLTADTEYTLVYRNGDDAFNIDETKTLGTITADGSGNAAFACYVSGVTTAEEYHGFLLTNTADGSDVRITSLATKALVSKVYNATREAYPANVTLSTMYSTDGNGKKYYAARDGQTLTGNFGGSEGYITIADGATVTLNIENFSAPYQCDHAPIHCLGDANIILADGMEAPVNAGNNSNYPAVFVPEGKTMTISGTGELIADGSFSNAAGIGGGWNITGGNIVIAGGIISAYGGNNSAAIGSSSSSSCGNITISGGAIKDAGDSGAGDYYGAGIGSGASGSCGNITISGGQIGGKIGGWSYDGAVGGQYAAGIGSGQGGSCGTITIGADITYVIVSSNSDSYPLIGGEWPNSCDVYFGDLKVYDKTAEKWYNSSTEAYDNNFPFDGNYGGLTFNNYYHNWILTPVTP